MLERLASNSSANKKCIIRITSLFFLSFFGFFFSLLRLMLSLHTFHGPDSDVVKPNSVCVRVFVSHREIVDLELIHLHFHRNERTTSLPQINTLETEEFSLSAKIKLHKRQQLVEIAEFIETHFSDHPNQCRRILCSGEFSHFKIRTILLWFLCRKKTSERNVHTHRTREVPQPINLCTFEKCLHSFRSKRQKLMNSDSSTPNTFIPRKR